MKFPLRLTLLFLLPAALSALEPARREEIQKLIREKNWTEARTQIAQVIAAEPDNAEAHFFLGQSFLYAREHEGAVPAFEMATALDPTNSRYQRHLGDAYGLTAQKVGVFSKMGWAKKCKAAYDKAVELDPKDIDARWSVMEYARQAPGFLGGGMDQAYAHAAAIKQLDAGAGRAAYVTLYLAEKKFTEAFAEFDEPLQKNPDNYEALLSVGRIAEGSGQQLDRGLTALRRCLTLPVPEKSAGHAVVQWRIGNILAQQGNKPAAIVAYQAALALDPKLTHATDALTKLNAKS